MFKDCGRVNKIDLEKRTKTVLILKMKKKRDGNKVNVQETFDYLFSGGRSSGRTS